MGVSCLEFGLAEVEVDGAGNRALIAGSFVLLR